MSAGALTRTGKVRQEILRLDLARDMYPHRGYTWEVLTQKIAALEKKLDDRMADTNTRTIATFLEKLRSDNNGHS